MHIRVLLKFSLLAFPLALASCASGSSAIWQTAKNVWGNEVDVSRVSLNPDFRYLRVTVDGRTVLLALGNTESHPQGPIEVWYSAEKEVIRLQNGRLVSAVGVTTEWRASSAPVLPSWTVLAKSHSPLEWTRTRDVMPGYRYGLKDTIVTNTIVAPSRSQLQGVDPQTLVWFEDRIESIGNTSRQSNTVARDSLPPAKYAVAIAGGAESVIYGEQCLASDLCISWQRWSANSAR